MTSFARGAYNCHWITASLAAGGKYDDYRKETSVDKGTSIFTTVQTSTVDTCTLNFLKDYIVVWDLRIRDVG